MSFTPRSALGGSISSSTDTNISSPSDGHVLTYTGSSAKWENKALDSTDIAGLQAYIDSRIQAANGGGTGGGGSQAITHGIVNASVTGTTVSLTGSITTTSSVTFDGLNISIAQDTTGYPWVASVGFANGATVDGTYNLSGSMTLAAGNYVAYVSYSIDGQSTWVTGPKTTIQVGAGGGTQTITHGTVSASVNTTSATLSGSITTTSSVTFDGLNISIAQDTTGYPWVKSIAISNGQTVNGTYSLSGSTSLALGNYVAYVSYSVDGQSTWVTGPKTSFQVASGGGGGSPSTKRMIMWHNSWELPLLSSYPSDVINNLTQISVGMAQSGSANTGIISYPGQSGQSTAQTAAAVAAWRAAGKDVIIGFGGAGSGGIHITNSTQAQQAISSLTNIINTYGFNGIDIDLEPGSSSWTNAALGQVCTSLRSTYGSSFVIGVTTSMYGTHTAAWMSFLNHIGTSAYTYTGPMLYDFPESTDSRLTSVTLDKANTMASNGIPDNKMVFGYMLQPHAGYNASPNVGVINNAYSAVKAQRPNILGQFFWASNIDAARNWEWSRGAYTGIFN